jgi:hypothetical protein
LNPADFRVGSCHSSAVKVTCRPRSASFDSRPPLSEPLPQAARPWWVTVLAWQCACRREADAKLDYRAPTPERQASSGPSRCAHRR